MKFGFVTCVQIGLSCMEAIYEIGGKLDLIISIPDEKSINKSGRIFVNDFAEKNNIPVVKTRHINDETAIKAIKDYEIDWLFIIGWSQIASKTLIETPKSGTIGAHPTLLPQGRGRAAIPWAIIKGLDKTGVTFFKMDEGVDTGPVLGQEIIPLSNDENATNLYRKVNKAHETLIKNMYFQLVENKISGEIQDESQATEWPGRRPEDGELFSTMNIEEADRLIRATTHPYPGAFMMIEGKKIIIWGASLQSVDNAVKLDFQDGSLYAKEFIWTSE
ncbi:methionyl-tRNA formyltransferase [Taibaiella lutea]|uniref:Methionyl-tRNA formyltransferase n=1 Tax=Taibaiella lutea TaxID=2608001 RepID=A0A5M6CF37_9BACT|nr:formyltransferase family protein [Taibaiella lutea]KAA5533784.1 methionyl-tRNA formyltransferase [Taibaiella lutea]